MSRAATLLIVFVAAAPAAAQTADTLTLGEAIALARTANPSLRAVRLRADAAAERIPQAGALPDPQLTLGLVNRSVDGFGTGPMMSMNSVELRQRFPWPGQLGFAKARARFLSDAAQLDAEETEAALIARVEGVYFELAYMDRTLTIMGGTRGLLRDFFEVTTALYAVGRGLQQDLLQAQVAIAQMTEDITVVEQRRLAMAARLNALLGRAATVAIEAVELPSIDGQLEDVSVLMELAAAHRPALRAAAARVDAAQAGYRAARRQLYPDLTFSLGYGQRPQFVDLVTLRLGISIPLFAGSKQLPLRREMQAMQSMEEARAVDLYNETYAQLAEARADAVRAQNLAALYESSVLPQARAAVESALSSYRVGQVDYMTLVQSQMTVNRYEIEAVRLVADYHRAVAAINALIGRADGGDQ